MKLADLPQPIVYALAIILVVIGSALAYRIATGSLFEYSGPLGDIKVGNGGEPTTLAEYVSETQAALDAAQQTIKSQDAKIAALSRDLATAIAQAKDLRELSERVAAAENAAQKERRIAALDRAARAGRMPAITSVVISQQEQLARRQVETLAKQTKDLSARIASGVKLSRGQ